MKWSFRKKLITIITSCCLLCILLVGSSGLFEISRILTAKAKQELALTADNKITNFNQLLTTLEDTTLFLASTLSSSLNLDRAIQDPSYLQETLDTYALSTIRVGEATDGIVSVYISLNPDLFGPKQGFWYADTNMDHKFDMQELTDVTAYGQNDVDAQWYHIPANTKKSMWIDPYLNPSMDLLVTSYVTPILSDNQLLGVLGMDIRFNYFQEEMERIAIYDSGYASLTSENGDFLIHPIFTMDDNLKNIENGSMNFLMNEYKKNESGIIEYKLMGKKKLQAYSRLSNGMTMTLSVPKHEVLKEVYYLIKVLLIISLIVLILTFIIIYYFSNSISNPIKLVTQVLNKTANYDLSVTNESEGKLSHIKNKDEIGIIASASLKMRKDFRDLIQLIKDSSTQILTSSSLLSGITNETVLSVETVADATNELAQGAVNLSKNAQDGVNKLDLLSKDIAAASDSANLMNDYISKVIHANQEGTKRINELQTDVKHNIEIIEKVNLQFDILSSNSKLISNISETIHSIASNIHLLSLNATIESARAGEHGRGFAVVAAEIRNLADAASWTTTEIGGIIEKIQTDVGKTKTYIESTTKLIAKTEFSSSETAQAFNLIDLSIQNIIDQVNSLLENIRIINSGKIEVVTSINDISAISQETAAATEEISASVQEQNASLEQIASSASSLTEIIKELELLINKFQI